MKKVLCTETEIYWDNWDRILLGQNGTSVGTNAMVRLICMFYVATLSCTTTDIPAIETFDAAEIS